MAESPAMREITDEEFQREVLESDTPVFIDFWAPWCGPCHIVAPILEELAPSYQDRLVMMKLNVDESPEAAQRYQVSSIPTMIIFKNGQVADRAIGAMPRGQLQSFIDRNL